MGAASVTLTQQEESELRKIVDEAEVAGSRVPEGYVLNNNLPVLLLSQIQC